MTNSNSYRLSLHISHPTIVASEIVRHFVLPVRNSKSVGEERRTPTGRELGGVYQDTDITFDVSGGVIQSDNLPLHDCILSSLRDLPQDAIKSFVATGGECFYLVGIYAQENELVYFSSQFLSTLSESSIGLKLDFYGGPD